MNKRKQIISQNFVLMEQISKSKFQVKVILYVYMYL